MFWCVSYYLGAFGTVFCPTTLSAKRVNWCNCSCHKVTLEFFATDAPDPPHWTLKFCFRAICTILVHLGLFGCLIKLVAERAEVVQKFMPRSRIGIFRDESTRSDPLDPKLTFWCVSYYLGAFATLWLPYNTQCKTGQTGAKVRATKSRWNFSNEHPRSTPLDPKLMFWCVLYYLGAFGTVWLRNNTYCKTGQTGEKLRAMKSHRNFFATNAPNSPHWIPNSCFGLFSTIWVHLRLFGCLTKLGAKRERTGAKVHATKSHRNFSQLKHPIRPIGP